MFMKKFEFQIDLICQGLMSFFEKFKVEFILNSKFKRLEDISINLEVKNEYIFIYRNIKIFLYCF